MSFHGCMNYAIINGHLSGLIYIRSPLSPILFLLVAQIFTCKLENNPNIEGIRIKYVYLLLSLFADDTDLFIQASLECLEAVLRDFAEFGDHSGCKCNVEKSKLCIPLGGAKNNLQT